MLRVSSDHEGHLVVFIAVQNLVGIGAVVLIMCMFSISRIWLENAYSRPQNWGLWGILPPKWAAVSTKPKNARYIVCYRVYWPASVFGWYRISKLSILYQPKTDVGQCFCSRYKIVTTRPKIVNWCREIKIEVSTPRNERKATDRDKAGSFGSTVVFSRQHIERRRRSGAETVNELRRAALIRRS